jgi:hypothetical protein
MEMWVKEVERLVLRQPKSELAQAVLEGSRAGPLTQQVAAWARTVWQQHGGCAPLPDKPICKHLLHVYERGQALSTRKSMSLSTLLINKVS